MTISLTTGITHQTDTKVKLMKIGIDYKTQRVILSVLLQQTGETRIYTIGSGSTDIDTIQGFIATFPTFSGLRGGIETYLSGKVPELSGAVT